MAVYTDVGAEELQTFLASYGVGRLLSFKGIAEGVENSNFQVHTDKGQFILTLYEKRVDPRDLPFFLGLMEHQAATGISCPLPLKNNRGLHLGTLAGRPAALVTFLEGVWLRKPEPRHCAAVGEALAAFHLAGRGFALTRANALGNGGWAPLFERFRRHADEIKPGLEAIIADELAFLANAWPRDLPSGVIHADLFQDNVFFIGDDLSGLIDFYFACNDALAYDVAICINAWCFEADGSFNATKCRSLVAGYQRVRPLERNESAALPVLARGSALRFLLTRGYDWINTPKDALVQRKDPLEYLTRLRFHQSVRSAAAYGAEVAA